MGYSKAAGPWAVRARRHNGQWFAIANVYGTREAFGSEHIAEHPESRRIAHVSRVTPGHTALDVSVTSPHANPLGDSWDVAVHPQLAPAKEIDSGQNPASQWCNRVNSSRGLLD